MQQASVCRVIGVFAVRYGIGGVMVLAGIVVLIVSPGGLGPHGFAIAVGAAASVLLVNVLSRVSVSGERDREREEEARRYFDRHGEWPVEDEPPAGRRWVLPQGVVTLEDEEDRERGRAAVAGGSRS
jgi:hypothetical protein